MNSRRDFLKLLAITGAYSGLGLTSFQRAAMANIPSDGNYKALVIISMHGGNDAFSTFTPNPYTSQFEALNLARRDLAINNNLLPLPQITKGIFSNTDAHPYFEPSKSTPLQYKKGVYSIGQELAVNGVMPELAHLIKNGKAKIVSNVGNLVRPVTKDLISTDETLLPPHLFAHNKQRQQTATASTNDFADKGWAGLLADQWAPLDNANLPYGLNMSMLRNATILKGAKTAPLVIPLDGVPNFNQLKYDEDNIDGAAKQAINNRTLFNYLNGGTGEPSADFNATGFHPKLDFTNLEKYEASSIIERTQQYLTNESADLLNNLSKDWDLAATKMSNTLNQIKDVYNNPLFSVPTSEQTNFDFSHNFGSFIEQMQSVATLIEIGRTNNQGRNIFFIEVGGFDTHSRQLEAHPELLRDYSLGIHSFQLAMEAMGLSDNVVTYTISDFGRTISSNGDGTDHGWGSHQIVTGGGMSTPELIGRVPDLTIGGVDDYSNKGRIIPTTSYDQLQATAAHWLGVSENELQTIFPNLVNFGNNSVQHALISNLFR